MACNYCKADLYIKTAQYSKPLLAPLTRAEELRQQLLDLTGEVYLQIPNEYCAMCGEKITRTPQKEEVKHGEWEQGDYYDIGDVCSVCQYDSQKEPCQDNYCPHCGAKMDGKDNNVLGNGRSDT